MFEFDGLTFDVIAAVSLLATLLKKIESKNNRPDGLINHIPRSSFTVD